MMKILIALGIVVAVLVVIYLVFSIVVFGGALWITIKEWLHLKKDIKEIMEDDTDAE